MISAFKGSFLSSILFTQNVSVWYKKKDLLAFDLP